MVEFQPSFGNLSLEQNSYGSYTASETRSLDGAYFFHVFIADGTASMCCANALGVCALCSWS